MNDRLAVPAELRRRVLVEAGHRCAIHTCRHPDVDIHHIVPWEQCHKHEYHNVIALCPNCHRRADAGEIDRLSLGMYKAKLVAAFGLSEPLPQEGNVSHTRPPEASWETATIREQSNDSLYEVALEFPEFGGNDSDIADLNVMLRADAIQRLADLEETQRMREMIDKGREGTEKLERALASQKPKQEGA
jgi:HNH endonuclease